MANLVLCVCLCNARDLDLKIHWKVYVCGERDRETEPEYKGNILELKR